MPTLTANGITMHYEQQGSGDPLVLIPYLSADCSCYAFQVAAYSRHFTCFSVDLRGAGGTDTPDGPYSTELFADDVAAFMQAAGIPQAHVTGLSLGAAVGMWVAAKYPEKVRSLSLHAGWPRTDAFARAVIDGWRVVAQGLDSVPEMVIRAIFPWCFTPELYESRPEFLQSLTDVVRSGPAQPLDAFMRQSEAVLGHDIGSGLERIGAPAQITFGEWDRLISTRFADRLTGGIRRSELLVFEGCAHAPIYEKVDEFNERTLEFLLRV